MKRNVVLTCLLAVFPLIGGGVACAETIELKAKPGSKVEIDGTSSVHDWTVQGSLIGGSVRIDGGFPVEMGDTAEPGRVMANVNAFIPITSLKSVKDGKPYSLKMDEIMHEKLGTPTFRFVSYRLDELTLKAAPESVGDPFLYDAKGWLGVAGVTNAIELPVEVTPLEDGRVKFTTKTSLKMTDFKIEPPAPKIALGMIKTGDEVQVSIEWMTARVPAN